MNRRTAWPDGDRTRGDVQAKAFQQTGAQGVAWFQEYDPKLFPQFGNRAVLTGFSGIFELFLFIVCGDVLVRVLGAGSGKASEIHRGIEILVHTDHGLSGEILQLKLGLERVIGRFNAPALKVQLACVADRHLLLVKIGQQGFRLSAGQTNFQNTDRKYLTIMGNGHLPLGFDLVNLQIPLLPYPHNEENPHVQRLRNESLGGIPAVKQQQTAGQPKFRQPLHMPDGKIALIRGVGRQLAVIYGMVQGAVGEKSPGQSRRLFWAPNNRKPP